MSVGAREHFDELAGRYGEAARTWQPIYEQTAAYLNPLIAGRDVLDIGNGGLFAYDRARARLVVASDISAAMLRGVDDPRVHKLQADARDLNGIKDEAVDVVLFVLSLHHITGGDVRESLGTLERTLRSAFRALRPGGHLVVVEPVVTGWLYRLQAACFSLTERVLHRFGVSMIFFYTTRLLRSYMARAFETTDSSIETHPIVVDQPVDLLGGTFPGLVVVPAWMCFWSGYRLLAVRKRGS